MLAERLLAPVARRGRRHARARLHALPVARPHDRRRDGSRRRARVERRRDRVRGARAARCRRTSACRCGSGRQRVRHERRRRDVPAARRAVPRPGSRTTWRRGRGADGARLLGLATARPRAARAAAISSAPATPCIWMDCGNGIVREPAAARRIPPTSPRSSSRTRTPTTASTSTGCTCCSSTASNAAAFRCTRPKASRSTLEGLVGEWTDTFDWQLVGDGDRVDDRRRRRCASRAPTTRRRPSRSRSRTTASGSCTPPTPARSGASRRSAGRRSRALGGDVPARRHPRADPPLGAPGRRSGARGAGARG